MPHLSWWLLVALVLALFLGAGVHGRVAMGFPEGSLTPETRGRMARRSSAVVLIILGFVGYLTW